MGKRFYFNERALQIMILKTELFFLKYNYSYAFFMRGMFKALHFDNRIAFLDQGSRIGIHPRNMSIALVKNVHGYSEL